MYKHQDFENLQIISDILFACNVPHDLHEWQDGYQITFDWCDGDVISTQYSFHLCESYHFPWDEGDITRAEPINMAHKIVGYYIETLLK